VKRLILAALSLVLHTLTAVFGPVLITPELSRALHLPSLHRTGLWLFALSDITVVFAFGFLVFRLRRLALAKWIWVIGVVWFSYFFIAAVREGTPLWPDFSGTTCLDVRTYLNCGWWVATVPALRTIFYSLGAFVCSRRSLTASPVPVLSDPLPEP